MSSSHHPAIVEHSAIAIPGGLSVNPAGALQLAPAAILPNNFGPTLLIMAGLWLSPLVVGVPILLIGLSQLRDQHGRQSFPFAFSVPFGFKG